MSYLLWTLGVTVVLGLIFLGLAIYFGAKGMRQYEEGHPSPKVVR